MKCRTWLFGAVMVLALAAQPTWAEPQGQDQETESAPVRVASDGDGGTSSTATQVGSVGAEVPVSVLSNDGGNPDTTGGGDGAEVVEAATEVGVGALAEVAGRGIREAAAATGATTDETSAAALRGVASGAAGSSSGGEGAAGAPGSGGLAEPPDSGGIGDTVALGDEGGGSLPLTGISSWLLIAAGVWLLLSGLALLLTLTLLRAPGRHIDAREATPLASRRFVR
jgi:hypothetical protein